MNMDMNNMNHEQIVALLRAPPGANAVAFPPVLRRRMEEIHDFEFGFEDVQAAPQPVAAPPPRDHVDTLNSLHDRTVAALTQIQDKVEQTMVISQATFDSLVTVQEIDHDLAVMFDPQIESNIFGDVCRGETFLKNLKKFPSTWRVFDAFYHAAAQITGRVSCSSSDQMMMFSMKWNTSKRHFIISKINHITDDSIFPPPIYGREQMPIHEFRPRDI
uniref:Polyprotein n=1 Tax=Caenorhabditis tropicalis TaxID=1561998 RepID=A0A1I7T8Y0_9PELO